MTDETNDNMAASAGRAELKTYPVTVIIGKDDEMLVTHIPAVVVPTWKTTYEEPRHFYGDAFTPRPPRIEKLTLELYDPQNINGEHYYTEIRHVGEETQDTANLIWMAMGLNPLELEFSKKLAQELQKFGLKVVQE